MCSSWISQWPYTIRIIIIIIIMQIYVGQNQVQPRHKYILLELLWQGMIPSKMLYFTACEIQL